MTRNLVTGAVVVDSVKVSIQLIVGMLTSGTNGEQLGHAVVVVFCVVVLTL